MFCMYKKRSNCYIRQTLVNERLKMTWEDNDFDQRDRNCTWLLMRHWISLGAIKIGNFPVD